MGDLKRVHLVFLKEYYTMSFFIQSKLVYSIHETLFSDVLNVSFFTHIFNFLPTLNDPYSLFIIIKGLYSDTFRSSSHVRASL